ncbi:glucose-responsive transcription factor [Purpureocillium lilacinum]|nr:glucose-responsive transcription factor [Purpureocillium lilacinum]
MSPDREGEPDEAGGLTYPSPGAEAMDAGPFYHANARDGPPEHTDQPEHHADEHVPEEVHAHEQEQAAMAAQESDTSHQHVSRPANLEELQLAAQLGDGLAGTSMMSTTDPSMNVEDHNMRSIMPHPEPEQHQTPSYIKELADRIHSIENKLESEGNLSQDDIDKLFASERPRSHSQHTGGYSSSTVGLGVSTTSASVGYVRRLCE